MSNDKSLCLKPKDHERPRTRIIVILVTIAWVLGLILGLLVWAARGETTTYAPATIVAAPGTLAGTADDVARSDNTRATFTEVDGTAIANALAWLKPDGDASPNAWAASVGTACVADGGTHYRRVCDDPIQDGNVSFLSTATANAITNFTLANFPITDVTFDTVRRWVWGRENTSVGGEIGIKLFTTGVGTSCTPDYQTVGLTQAFANFSDGIPDPNCAGTAWSTTTINGLVLQLQHNALGTVTATSTGATVQYDDSDFAVAAYLNFTGLPSLADAVANLWYEGSTTTPDALNLQVNRGGTWTTLVSSAFTGTESLNAYRIDPALDVVGNAAQFRVVDVTTNDETGGALSLDQFAITVEANPPPIGGDLARLLHLRCTPGLGTIACTVTLDPLVVGIEITGSQWFVDQGYQRDGSGGPRAHSAVVDAFPFPSGTVNVTVRLSFTNGQVLAIGTDVFVDNSWVLLLLLLATVALVVVALAVYARRRGRGRRKSKEQEWAEEYTFWGEVLK